MKKLSVKQHTKYIKQTKVLKKINYDSGQTTPSGTLNNDECYTPLQFIINELLNYPNNYFHNKNGISPFDWDLFSDHPEIYGIKFIFDKYGNVKEVLNLTSDNKNRAVPHNHTTIIDISYNEQNKKFFINNKEVNGPRCNFIKSILNFAKQWKPKSWVFSGYNPELKQGIDYKTYDYKDFDIVITNPAFTCIKDFLNILIKSKTNFIILSDFLSRGNPRVGLHLMLNECYLGFNIGFHIPFENWDIKTMALRKKKKIVLVDWITSFTDARKVRSKKPFKTGIKYEIYKSDYPIIKTVTMKDGTHPIRLNNFKSLPDDYYGWFFSSIGVLDAIDGKNFEWYGTHYTGWHNSNRDKTPFDLSKFKNNRYNEEWQILNGKKLFNGIIARRIKNEINS